MTAAVAVSVATTVSPAAGGEFLTFALGGEEYGIDILRVQEIRGYELATVMPNAPAFIKGVVNLRGTIVPIVDMRIKFDFPEVQYTASTVVIVVNVASRVIGLVVDRVSDVVALSPEQVKPAPDFTAHFGSRYILGLGAVEEHMLILLDIEQLISSSDMGLIEEAAA